MLTKMYCFATVFLLIVFIVNPQVVLSASAAVDVKYEENRLSVRADGVSLAQLLSTVEKKTGVVFSYDDAMVALPVSVYFENNTLSDGLGRILSHFNYSTIYDKSHHIKSVSILNRKKVSGVTAGNRTDSSESFESLEDMIMALDDDEENVFSDVPPDRDETKLPFSAVDPNVPPPPGEEPLKTVLDPNIPLPPGVDPSDLKSMILPVPPSQKNSGTEK